MAQLLVDITNRFIPFFQIFHCDLIVITITLLISAYALYSVFRYLTDRENFKPNWILLMLLPLLFCFNLLFRYYGYSSGRFTQCQSNIKNLGTALDMYASDNDGNYPATLKKLNPEYLRVIPTCAQAWKDTYTDGYVVYNDLKDPENNRYTLYCSGKYHKLVGVPRNYPQYCSNEGLLPR